MKDDARWTLRLPRVLRERLKQLAVREHRSLNGQIVAALEYYADRLERDGEARDEHHSPA